MTGLTVNIWVFLSYIIEIPELWFSVYFFNSEICPPKKGICASLPVIFTNSVTQGLQLDEATKTIADAHLCCVMNTDDSQFGTYSSYRRASG